MAGRVTGTGLHRNTLSYFGFLVSFIGAFLTLFALAVELSLRAPSPYLGIFTYMIFPAIMTCGLALVLLGMWRESRRRRRAGTVEALPFPRLDLNDPRQRRRFTQIGLGGFFGLLLLGFVGYNAFLFTESNTFCGRLCHSVMQPEYTAYQESPHARVKCVECHVGSGASFYVKSKLSGVRQVLAVLFHSYETPIPTPITNLRPARETCEECHWPQKFYGAQLLQIPFFRPDEANTNDQISLLVKTGGGSANLGQSAGIHWHMIINNRITFATADPKQQQIPWFKVTGAYGQERVYRSLDNPLSDEEISRLPQHTMDCIDCHNRPTHIFPSPDRAVDLSLANGSIADDLPWIKKVATEALTTSYPDRETAGGMIRDRVFNFYADRYPELYKTRAGDVQDAVRMAVGIYQRTVFPTMKVDWGTYPENIGHRNWPGCFRCHDGRHATADGAILTKECTVCHTMPQRGPQEALGALPPVSGESWHPLSLLGKHADLLCHECHGPGKVLTGDCTSCHQRPGDAPMAEMDCSDCHLEPQQRLPVADCALCHDTLAGAHLEGGHPDAACTDCHAPHGWKVEGREACSTCHEGYEEHYPPGPCAECHEFSG